MQADTMDESVDTRLVIQQSYNHAQKDLQGAAAAEMRALDELVGGCINLDDDKLADFDKLVELEKAATLAHRKHVAARGKFFANAREALKHSQEYR